MIEDVQLTEDFWLHEFLNSSTAARYGHVLVPTKEHILNLRRLCVTVLQPFRTRIRRVITITSGYRDLWLNTLKKGAKDSAHMRGRAADFLVAGMSASTVARWIARYHQEQLAAGINPNAPDQIAFDKVIDEFELWTHAQAPELGQKPRYEYLLARKVNDQTVYTLGQL